MKRDMFVLIIGHGRSGTSLCTGLLNSSPDFNLAYEYNNYILINQKPGFIEKGGVLPSEFNGNKVAIGNGSKFSVFLECFANRKYFMHDQFSELKVIFTKRNLIDTMISGKVRVATKGINLSVNEVVDMWVKSEKIIVQLKNFFKDFFVFDFDEIILHDEPKINLFNYVNSSYKKEYSDNYLGVINYAGVEGVGIQNVISKKEEHLSLRRELEVLLERRNQL